MESYYMELTNSDMVLISECGARYVMEDWKQGEVRGRTGYDLPGTVLAFLIEALLETACDYYEHEDPEMRELSENCDGFASSIAYSIGMEEVFLVLDNAIAVSPSQALKQSFEVDDLGYCVVKSDDFPELVEAFLKACQDKHDNGEGWI